MHIFSKLTTAHCVRVMHYITSVLEVWTATILVLQIVEPKTQHLLGSSGGLPDVGFYGENTMEYTI
jgi:hypothetical protein